MALRFSQVVRRSFRTSRQDNVYVVPSASQAIYEDLTGTRAVASFRPDAEDRPLRHLAGSRECQNPQP